MYRETRAGHEGEGPRNFYLWEGTCGSFVMEWSLRTLPCSLTCHQAWTWWSSQRQKAQQICHSLIEWLSCQQLLRGLAESPLTCDSHLNLKALWRIPWRTLGIGPIHAQNGQDVFSPDAPAVREPLCGGETLTNRQQPARSGLWPFAESLGAL